MVSVIAGESRRLSRLIENLLELSRLQAGSAHPRREWSSIEELLGEAAGELRAEPGQFSLAVDSDLRLVRLDPAQMSRAFVNVLENARRHSGGHPVSVRARAVHGSTDARRPAEGWACRAAACGQGPRREDRDPGRGSGPGHSAGQLEQVFQPFYRSTAPADHGGSGLGLAIARGFTEANGGTLHVESLPGQGATFVFELPLDGPGGAHCRAPARRRPRAAIAVRSRRRRVRRGRGPRTHRRRGSGERRRRLARRGGRATGAAGSAGAGAGR